MNDLPESPDQPSPEFPSPSRIQRMLREDFLRLGTQEMWEEMVFSLSVVCGLFLFLGLLTELLLELHG